MTSLDPSHIPVPFSSGKHKTWGQAGYSFKDDEDHPQPALHIPKIPDLRFEQGYLLSIRPFIHDIPPTEEGEASEKQAGHEGTQAFVKEGVIPGSSTYGVPIRIDWQGVAWVTFRDQLLSPLIQGAAWGTASIFLIPLLQQSRIRLWNVFKSSPAPDAPVPQVTPPRTTEEVGPWRKWVKSLLGGVETNVALAK